MARLLFNAVASAAAVAIFVSSISVFAPAAAEDITTYPSATIRIVVPYPAGGTADALPRIIGDRLQAHWSEPVIIVNRPGAGGNIGAEMVAMAEPNGYTLQVHLDRSPSTKRFTRNWHTAPPSLNQRS